MKSRAASKRPPTIELWAVIGDNNMRKTSTVRALTGVYRLQEQWEVDYGSGPVLTFVEPSALQERILKPPLKTFAGISRYYISKIQKARVSKAILALRYRHRTKADADRYLTAFQNAGWRIKGHAVLGAQPLLGFPGGIPIPNSTRLASNEIAALCRSAWGIR